ncbi:hypothetical protein FB451DRAFT_1292939 [Mycena latifolia]|nr:hypothetical protein FB451DRAFT_1292939 [Mycena latifolia]
MRLYEPVFKGWIGRFGKFCNGFFEVLLEAEENCMCAGKHRLLGRRHLSGRRTKCFEPLRHHLQGFPLGGGKLVLTKLAILSDIVEDRQADQHENSVHGARCSIGTYLNGLNYLEHGTANCAGGSDNLGIILVVHLSRLVVLCPSQGLCRRILVDSRAGLCRLLLVFGKCSDCLEKLINEGTNYLEGGKVYSMGHASHTAIMTGEWDV